MWQWLLGAATGLADVATQVLWSRAHSLKIEECIEDDAEGGLL